MFLLIFVYRLEIDSQISPVKCQITYYSPDILLVKLLMLLIVANHETSVCMTP